MSDTEHQIENPGRRSFLRKCAMGTGAAVLAAVSLQPALADAINANLTDTDDMQDEIGNPLALNRHDNMNGPDQQFEEQTVIEELIPIMTEEEYDIEIF